MTRTPNDIIESAKNDTRKGDYRVYETYKQRLLDCCTSSAEYGEYCRRLAKALWV